MDINDIKIGMKVIPINPPIEGTIRSTLIGRDFLYVRDILYADNYALYMPKFLSEHPIAIECGIYPQKYAIIRYFTPEDLVPYANKNERNFYGRGVLENGTQ